ncbi:hypothetical protein IAE39_000543 [Pseudomonas sp. S37]|uniref:hypothetical protein n=1 Tax=unclassified Pseudomonas TaxID=196821 RepID=UPI001379A2A0|nr:MULTISPECIES: hypothetical protein [unclassified Pseudomonas]KAF1312504.1 hypothetical protein BLX42_03115 [Pseudomonas sp. SG-MS2]MBK4992369.1 hypothetical protein [Pseudomonas sp. S37]
MADERDDTVYCDIKMPVDQGRELLKLVQALRESRDHPHLERVLSDMEYELTTSIDIVDNPPSWGFWVH